MNQYINFNESITQFFVQKAFVLEAKKMVKISNGIYLLGPLSDNL